MVVVYRTTPFRFPTVRLVREALRSSWGMFLFRSAEMLYTMSNVFLPGLFAPAAVVGYFAGAERLSRSIFGLFNPIRDALYPRLSALVQKSPRDAARLARVSMAVTTGGGFLMGLALTLAPRSSSAF